MAKKIDPVKREELIGKDLHYYRCLDCLSVITTDYKHKIHYDDDGKLVYLQCECGGRYEYMGEVHRDRLVKHEHRVSCNESCASARGPKCSCKCGGLYHGLNLYTDVTVDVGKVPMVSMPNEKALKTAQEFRTMRDFVNKTIENHFGYEPGRGYPWLPRDVWMRKVEITQFFHKACKGKIHSMRMKNFIKALALMGIEYNPEVETSAE